MAFQSASSFAPVLSLASIRGKVSHWRPPEIDSTARLTLCLRRLPELLPTAGVSLAEGSIGFFIKLLLSYILLANGEQSPVGCRRAQRAITTTVKMTATLSHRKPTLSRSRGLYAGNEYSSVQFRLPALKADKGTPRALNPTTKPTEPATTTKPQGRPTNFSRLRALPRPPYIYEKMPEMADFTHKQKTARRRLCSLKIDSHCVGTCPVVGV